MCVAQARANAQNAEAMAVPRASVMPPPQTDAAAAAADPSDVSISVAGGGATTTTARGTERHNFGQQKVRRPRDVDA
jgi:hypothetical protein